MPLRYILGGALILAAMMSVSVVTYFQNQERYYTVDEFLATQTGNSTVGASEVALGSAVGPRLQLRGGIDHEAVSRPELGQSFHFGLQGDEGEIAVVYQGVVPDTFELAESLTVGGRMTDSGVFKADELFVQCPSKYEAMPPGMEVEAEGPDASSNG